MAIDHGGCLGDRFGISDLRFFFLVGEKGQICDLGFRFVSNLGGSRLRFGTLNGLRLRIALG